MGLFDSGFRRGFTQTFQPAFAQSQKAAQARLQAANKRKAQVQLQSEVSLEESINRASRIQDAFEAKGFTGQFKIDQSTGNIITTSIKPITHASSQLEKAKQLNIEKGPAAVRKQFSSSIANKVISEESNALLDEQRNQTNKWVRQLGDFKSKETALRDINKRESFLNASGVDTAFLREQAKKLPTEATIDFVQDLSGEGLFNLKETFNNFDEFLDFFNKQKDKTKIDIDAPEVAIFLQEEGITRDVNGNLYAKRKDGKWHLIER